MDCTSPRLLTAALFLTGCVSSQEPDAATSAPLMDSMGSTGATTETSGPTSVDPPAPTEGDASGTTTGQDSEGSSPEGDETSSGGDETSTGTDDTGDESSTGEDTTGDTTAEACELGTDLDCLACGDTCSLDGACTPEGCLEPLTLGHDEAFDDVGGLDGILWGFPVELEDAATLTHLAFIAGGAGGDLQLSLYTDAADAPGNRIVTAAMVLGYASGTHETAVPPVDLEPGTYWVMATATNPTRVAMDLNDGAVNFPVQGIVHEFADGHPDVIAEPIAFVNFRPNFYLRLEQLQTGD